MLARLFCPRCMGLRFGPKHLILRMIGLDGWPG